MVMGCDAVLAIDRWRDWQDLLELAHIVVIAGPDGSYRPAVRSPQWLTTHRADSAAALRQQPRGTILIEELRPLAISSTEIREPATIGQSARYLLPQSVLDYIQSHKLYQLSRIGQL